MAAIVEGGGFTDVGRVRELNEDDWGSPESMHVPSGLLERKGRLYVVADGMGGHQAGDVASRLAVNALFKAYYGDDDSDLPGSLVRAVQQANEVVYAEASTDASREGMGTTVVVALVKGSDLWVANVGDSRAYFVRSRAIRQITKDHSWVMEQARAGVLSDDEARHHPMRNVITRSVGSDPNVKVDIFREALNPGDKVLLCSDGLSNEVSDGQMAGAMSAAGPESAARSVVRLANEHGARDNVTAVVIEMSPEEKLTGAIPAWVPPAVLSVLVVVVAAAVIGIVRGREKEQTVASQPPTAAVVPTDVKAQISTHPSATASASGDAETLSPTGTSTQTAAAAATSTPAPTPTPTVNPRTDVLKVPYLAYTVKEGDSFTFIAHHFGVPEEALQEVDKKVDQIAQDNDHAMRDRNPDFIIPERVIHVVPSHLRHVLVGEVKDMPDVETPGSFTLRIEGTDRDYTVQLKDAGVARTNKANRPHDGEMVRVVGEKQGEAVVVAEIVDMDRNGKWENWHWSWGDQRESPPVWVALILEPEGVRGIGDLSQYLDAYGGKVLVAKGRWTRKINDIDFKADEVHIQETDGAVCTPVLVQ